MATGKAVAKVSENEVVTGQEQVPDFLKGRTGPARGSENVKAEDLVIPRLELVQALSPCLQENKPEYIEGAKAGMLFNNVTRQLYGTSVKIIPVQFRKEYIVWKSRKLGGGFIGAFSTMESAEDIRMAQDKPDDHQTNDTANFFSLLINPQTGNLEEIVVSMSITKLKVARKLNSLIRLNGGDSFSRWYTLGSGVEQNSLNQDYHNFTIASGGYVTAEQFDRAEALYEAVKSGLAVANRDDETGTDTGPISGGAEY